MKFKSYGFIVMAHRFSPKMKKHVFTSQHFKTTVVCVSSFEEACVEAQNLVEEGIQLLELCGGFGKDLCEKIIEFIDGKIPVGYVEFFPSEQKKLDNVLLN